MDPAALKSATSKTQIINPGVTLCTKKVHILEDQRTRSIIFTFSYTIGMALQADRLETSISLIEFHKIYNSY